MTTLLKEAFTKASALPAKDQDAFARFLIAEIDDEAEWDASFSSSQNEIALMAKEALAEYKTGKTKPLDMITRGI